MKQVPALACALLAPFVVSPAFADDKFETKKAEALEMITKRLEKIKAQEACVISSENMDQLKECKIKIISLLRKTHPKSMLKGF